MRLDARIKRLEGAQGDVAQDMSKYDEMRDYDKHRFYFCNDDGSEASCIASAYDGHDSYRFATEQELWESYPTGTKFLRGSRGQSHEVIDGVMRELHFPPPDNELVAALQALTDSMTNRNE